MSEKIEGLRQDIAELTRTVQEHKSDPATIDYDSLAETLLEKQEELQVQRRGLNDGNDDGELVGPEGFRVPGSKHVKSGKFAGQKVDELRMIRNMLTR